MTTSAPMLPYGRAVLDEEDIAAVADALRAGHLTDGPTVEAFEHAFATATGAAEAATKASPATRMAVSSRPYAISSSLERGPYGNRPVSPT